jgi:hypothetical protein
MVKRKRKKKKDNNEGMKLPSLKKYGKYFVPTKRIVIKLGKRK